MSWVADVCVYQVCCPCVQAGVNGLPSLEYLSPEGVAQSQAQGLHVLGKEGYGG